jgi:membrane protein DedA with SNARE-associated domain
MISTEHLPSSIQALAPTVNHYGYFAVGGLLLLENLGLPVPGETVLIASAVFCAFGKLNIIAVIVIAIICAIFGDNLGFAIGRYGGHRLIEKWGKYVFLTPKRISKAEGFYTKNGVKVILVARFIDGLRQANGIIAGLTDIKWKKFITFNAIGAVLWVLTWSLLGYYGANQITTILHYQLYFSIGLAACVVLFITYKLLNKGAHEAS